MGSLCLWQTVKVPWCFLGSSYWSESQAILKLRVPQAPDSSKVYREKKTQATTTEIPIFFFPFQFSREKKLVETQLDSDYILLCTSISLVNNKRGNKGMAPCPVAWQQLKNHGGQKSTSSLFSNVDDDKVQVSSSSWQPLSSPILVLYFRQILFSLSRLHNTYTRHFLVRCK